MLTAEQNETIVEIARMIAELNKELAPEDKHELAVTVDLNTLIEQKTLLLSVFQKLKPIFTGFTGKDIMSALPEIMPAVQALQNDKELSENMAKIVELV